ncbi:MAG TPA: hypothetical protein VMR14_06295 [Streptosporangiaceae bacterium]|jgi:hypothetical protein|nr:hypothetical protein [Streptosporangiaceae bacterium]
MATAKQSQAAKRGVKKAQQTASGKKTIANVPKQSRVTMTKRGTSAQPKTAPKTAIAQSKRTRIATPKTRTELYAMAQKRDLPGRSKMGRDELAKALGVR